VDKIVLLGYYGFGNFGDDILMLTSYRMLREIFPDAEIVISSESKNPEYIQRLLPGTRVINSVTEFSCDLAFHGGGGVFFDFNEGGLTHLIRNKTILTLGFKNFIWLFRIYKKLKGVAFLKPKLRVGMGIGVGSYTNASIKFLYDILSLGDFDFLMVRDRLSEDNARRLKLHAEIHQGSDLAFAPEFWNMNQHVKQNSDAVGFVLRDWKDDRHIAPLYKTAKILKQSGKKVKLFSFDKRTDINYIKSAAAVGSVIVWDPSHMSIDYFLNEMSKCQLVVSSRAHGAIVSACLGIPAVCVAIEPKLKMVSEMLQNSATIIDESLSQEEIIQIINERLENLSQYALGTKKDCEINRAKVLSGLNIFKSFAEQMSQQTA
jgi:polysaccharide pyruvyl transferase WcaK-like protein